MLRRSQPLDEFYDGVVQSSLHIDRDGPDGGTIMRLDKQDCSEILKFNQELRDAGGTRSTSFGMQELCIPELVLNKLKRKYPELSAPDKDVRVKAWKRFIGSSEAKPYKISGRRYV